MFEARSNEGQPRWAVSGTSRLDYPASAGSYHFYGTVEKKATTIALDPEADQLLTRAALAQLH